MTRLDRLERLFFEEAPGAFKALGLMIGAGAVLGGLAVALVHDAGAGLRLAALLAVPSVACVSLGAAIAARSVLTLPLAALVCAMGAWLTSDPSGAAEGVRPYIPTLIGVWALAIAEYLAIGAFIVFLAVLWARGAFR